MHEGLFSKTGYNLFTSVSSWNSLICNRSSLPAMSLLFV